jgi:hypothetical protein
MKSSKEKLEIGRINSWKHRLKFKLQKRGKLTNINKNKKRCKVPEKRGGGIIYT